MKKVAIIIQKMNGGGAERTASNLSLILSKHYNVHLIVFDGREIAYPYEGTFHDLKLPPVGGKMQKLRRMCARVQAVKKILKEEKIDCAISLMDGANLVNVLAKGKNKVLTSVRIQMSKSGTGGFGAKAGVRKKVMQFIGNRSNCVVALSKGVEIDLNEKFGIPAEKLTTIYNPCDGKKLKEVTSLKEKTLVLEKGNALATMGRLTNQKGQWHLIRALTLVKEQIPDVKLYIFGEGEKFYPRR